MSSLNIESFCNTQIVSYADQYLGDEECTRICSALSLSNNIIELDMKGNDIRAKGAKALGAMLRTNSSLKVLHLEWNFIGDPNSLSFLLDSLSCNITLVELDLRNNRICADGAKLLASMLKSNRSLKRLDLRWNNLGSKGATFLANALDGNCSLTELFLSGNGVSQHLNNHIVELLARNTSSKTMPSSTLRRVEKHFEYFIPRDKSQQRIDELVKDNFTLKDRMFTLQQGIDMDRASIEQMKIILDDEKLRSNQEQQMLRTKLDQEKQFLESEQQIRRCLENDKQILTDKLNSINEQLKDLITSQQQTQTIESNRRTQYEVEVSHLKSKLTHDEANYATQINDLVKQVTNERELRRVEKEVAVQIHAQLKSDLETAMKEALEHANAKKLLENAQIVKAEKDQANAIEETKKIRQQLIQSKIDHEEEFAVFERKVRKQHSQDYDSKLVLVEERLEQLKIARERFEAKDKEHRIEFEDVMHKSELERIEFKQWLDEEKKSREKAETKARTLQVELEHARSTQHHLEQQYQHLQTRAENAEHQCEQWKIKHNSTLSQTQQIHKANIKALEAKIHQKDKILTLQSQRIRAAESVSVQLNEEKCRRDFSLNTALEELKHVLHDDSSSSLIDPQHYRENKEIMFKRKPRAKNREKSHLRNSEYSSEIKHEQFDNNDVIQ